MTVPPDLSETETPGCNTGGFVEIVDVDGGIEPLRWGVDDLTLGWDYSGSPTLHKLLSLPKTMTPRGWRFGEVGAFGRWEDYFAPHYASMRDETKRLYVQLKMHGDGLLTSPEGLSERVQSFLVGLAVRGLEPYSEAVCTRVDVAVDVRCRPEVGRELLDAMAAVRLSGGRRVDVAGDQRSTVYYRPRAGRDVHARTYCRNIKTGKGEPFGLIRFEAVHRFKPSDRVMFSTVEEPGALRRLWLSRFGGGEVGARVRRIGREVQTVTLADLVESGQIGYAQMERLSTFLDLERLGRARRVYPPSVYAARRREARNLGLAPSSGDEVLDVELAELLAPVRAVWQE